MTIPDFIVQAARDGAPEGQRNGRAFWLAAQLRDARVPRGEAEGILAEFGRNCRPPMPEREAIGTWGSACREPPRDPPASGRSRRGEEARPLDWSSPIGPGMGEIPEAAGPDYVEPVPAPSMSPIEEMVSYLEALFQEDERVSYVMSSFQDPGDGKWKPNGRGVYSRTRGEICAEIRRYQAKGVPDREAIENALGSWEESAGGWIRLNPMTGAGVLNDDVADCRHALVECDAVSVEQQLAVIRSLNLPVTAIVHSGGKSLHAVTRIDAGQDRALYRQRVDQLFTVLEQAGYKVDRQCRNPSRLSRLPGLTRGGARQYLVDLGGGAASWDAWEASRKAEAYSAEILGPDQIEAKQADDSLLGNRFLTRGGSWLVVAQSGIGKSVLCLQGAISFSCGRDLFGLKPAGPLRNLIIQAENNRLDVQEAYRGVIEGSNLSADDRRAIRANLSVVAADSYTGGEFCAFLDYLCRRLHPDIVWIDPLLAYIGGEISRMADCARFLRNQLNPVIHEHGVGVAVIHHTAKPPKASDDRYAGRDLAYLGIGSSDLTNWARATSTILACDGCDNRYTLAHQKRAGKAGCDATTDIMHATPPSVRWVAAPGRTPTQDEGRRHPGQRTDRPERDDGVPGYRGKYANLGFEIMPPLDHDPQDKEASPLLAWIETNIREKAVSVSASADSIRSSLEKAGLIKFNRESRTWQGFLYDQSFASFA